MLVPLSHPALCGWMRIGRILGRGFTIALPVAKAFMQWTESFWGLSRS